MGRVEPCEHDGVFSLAVVGTSRDDAEPANGADAYVLRTTAPLIGTCAPGMARYFIGVSPMARYSQSRRQGEEQGRRREAGSGGSSIRNCGAMNKNRILGVMHLGRAGT